MVERVHLERLMALYLGLPALIALGHAQALRAHAKWLLRLLHEKQPQKNRKHHLAASHCGCPELGMPIHSREVSASSFVARSNQSEHLQGIASGDNRQQAEKKACAPSGRS